MKTIRIAYLQTDSINLGNGYYSDVDVVTYTDVEVVPEFKCNPTTLNAVLNEGLHNKKDFQIVAWSVFEA